MTPEKTVVLFGAGFIAKVVRHYLEHESDLRVVATTVDREHVESGPGLGVPIVPFDEVAQQYPPERHGFFVAVGYRGMNGVRAERCEQARSLGYELLTHVSPRASTWPDLAIGHNCLVMDNVLIEPWARIGDGCVLWSGSHIGHGAQLGNHCWVAAQATLSGLARVGDRTFLGTGSIVRDGIAVGDRCLIGAGAVITSDVADDVIHAAAPPRLLPGRSERLPSF
jgi:sugar O-acyltransferase (sialic acid O-acetyltransferase NeuD family)